MPIITKQSKYYNQHLYVSSSGKTLFLKGIFGSYTYAMTTSFFYSPKEKKFWLKSNGKISNSFLGLSKILLAQAWLGSLLGYRQQLNIVGIGYNAAFNAETMVLKLKLGFSHIVLFYGSNSVEICCPKPRLITLRGLNLEKVQNLAAIIRGLKLPNAYKEKGIYYAGEKLRLKQGKKT